MILQDKTVIVSGVGPGLGGEVARLALRDGAKVMIGARTETRLKEMAERLDPTGERVGFHAFDITDETACESLVAAAEQRFGGVDAMAQVAALDALFGTLESTPAEDLRKAMEVNLIGSLQLARGAARAMKKSGGGSIVLVGSQSFQQPPPMQQIAYASSKGALISAMYHMAAELGPHKIRVNTVIPTWMWGPPVEMYVNWQAKERGVPAREVIAEITANMPLGEIPPDEDVAEAIVFFCSDRARMITGQSLRVDAGEVMG